MLRDETSDRERALVLRADRPRQIDALIDYFGELHEVREKERKEPRTSLD